MKKKRLTHIDMLELIAMLFVVLYHGTLCSYNFLEESNITYYLYYYFKAILSTCVPLFFFANGFLLFRKEIILRKHILKMVKLILQTIIWAIIILIFQQFINQEFLSFTEFIKAIWQWKMGWIHYLWYMGALVCIYVFFPLLKNIYDTNYKFFIYFTIVCAVLTIGNTFINQMGTVFVNVVLDKGIVFQGVNFFNIFNPFRGIYGFSFFYFCMGGVVHRYKNNIERIDVKKRNLISIIGILISCLGLFLVGLCYSKASGLVWDIVWNGYDSIFTLMNVLFIYVLCLNWKKNLLFVRIISNNTLGIYFIHIIINSFLKPKIMNFEVLRNLPFNLLYVVLILMISAGISLILKKIPIVSNLLK